MPRISAASLVEHRALMTERLLDAWGELMGERGFAELTLADVAARAGVSRTTVYTYVPDKETLLMAYLDREVRRSVEALAAELAAAPGPRERLAAYLRFQVRYIATNPATAQDLESSLNATHWARFEQHVQPVTAMLHEVLREGMARGEFVDADVELVTDLVQGTVWGQRTALARGGRDPEVAAALVVDVVLRGLAPATRGSRRRTRR